MAEIDGKLGWLTWPLNGLTWTLKEMYQKRKKRGRSGRIAEEGKGNHLLYNFSSCEVAVLLLLHGPCMCNFQLQSFSSYLLFFNPKAAYLPLVLHVTHPSKHKAISPCLHLHCYKVHCTILFFPLQNMLFTHLYLLLGFTLVQCS